MTSELIQLDAAGQLPSLFSLFVDLVYYIIF